VTNVKAKAITRALDQNHGTWVSSPRANDQLLAPDGLADQLVRVLRRTGSDDVAVAGALSIIPMQTITTTRVAPARTAITQRRVPSTPRIPLAPIARSPEEVEDRRRALRARR
jgi:hypothetical protein